MLAGGMEYGVSAVSSDESDKTEHHIHFLSDVFQFRSVTATDFRRDPTVKINFPQRLHEQDDP